MLSLREPMLIRGLVRTERRERIILTGLEVKRPQETLAFISRIYYEEGIDAGGISPRVMNNHVIGHS